VVSHICQKQADMGRPAFVGQRGSKGLNCIANAQGARINLSAAGCVPGKAYMLVKLQSAVALFTCGCLVSVAASPSSIGFVVTNGQAQVDGAVVHSNSTLFQGSLVQAGNAASDLMLPGGSNLLLQPGSAAKVYREHAVLQRGIAVQRGNQGYSVFADGLKVSSLSPQGAVVVGMKDGSHLEVAAQGGAAEVRTPVGVLVARLEPGKALSFAIQVSPQGPTPPALQQNPPSPAPGPAEPPPSVVQVTVHGLLHKDHAGRYGHYLVTDLATTTVYELRGPDLEDLVGASIEATGSILDTAAAGGAAKVISVSDIHQMPLSEITGNENAAPPAAAPPAAAPPSPTAAPGAGPEVGATPAANAPPEPSAAPTPPSVAVHSDTAKIIVIVGIAAGAVVGVALGLGGGKSSTVSPE
jgi:hypothetical protein